VISRLNRDRRLERGQVARDPAESGFGTSAFSTLEGARRTAKSRVATGPTETVWSITRGIGIGTRGSGIQGLDIASGDIPKY
jgi:hypothetical protein